MAASERKGLVIFGNRQIAEIAHFYLTHDSPYTVAAFTVDGAYLDETTFCGLPVVPFEELGRSFPAEEWDGFVAVSYQGVNRLRAEKYAQFKAGGYHLASYVSTRAVTWPGLVHGDNCFILENNVVQPFVRIGNNVTLWSGNHIGHHSVIEDHCFLASHVVISGNCRVEPYCFLGVNATLRDGITLAPRTVVGAGATILKDTREAGVYPGPASRPAPVSSHELPEF